VIRIPNTDAELLAECDVQTFRSSGKGGQHVNKVETGVRMRHRPSGLVVASQKERSQYMNKRACLARLRKKLAVLNEVPVERVPTKAPRAEREKRLTTKRIRGDVKRLRKRPAADD
jgi:protein subunit release factor B